MAYSSRSRTVRAAPLSEDEVTRIIKKERKLNRLDAGLPADDTAASAARALRRSLAAELNSPDPALRLHAEAALKAL